MPALHGQDNKYQNNGFQPHWTSLLQKHSINDLFGLNKPRGLLGNSFESSVNGLCTPPASHPSNSRNANIKFEGFFPSRTIRRTFRSTSLSDCSGSGSPAVLDPLLGVGGSPSSPDESSDNSTTSSSDGSLNDILKSITISDDFDTSSPHNQHQRQLSSAENLTNYQPSIIGTPSSPSIQSNQQLFHHSLSNSSSTSSNCTSFSSTNSTNGFAAAAAACAAASNNIDLFELAQMQNQLLLQQTIAGVTNPFAKCVGGGHGNQHQQGLLLNAILGSGVNNGSGGGSACAQAQLANQLNGNSAAMLSLMLNQQQQQQQQQDHWNLERVARFHRNAASVYDATYAWSGVLPVRTTEPMGYSSKVFLGGVPWDISEQMLMQTFKQFGPIRVEWPGKERQATQPKGYVYIVFESEKNVKALLQCCSNDYPNSGNWYFKISSKRMKAKEVQVIPWILNDSNYTKSTSQKLDPSKTVFVGALHGMLNAHGLAKIMNDLFDGVVYAGIDTDKYKYPIGSGRVTFSNPRSYMKAVAAAFIEIKTLKFTKKVQVDPYLEDSLCSMCEVQQGPYFCRDMQCFRYFCRTCWSCQHGQELRTHKPLMRNSKNSATVNVPAPVDPNISLRTRCSFPY